MSLFSSHCVTGVGFGKDQYGPVETGEEDNALSPDTCYECKVNGYPKKYGRKRRSTNETAEVRVAPLKFQILSIEKNLQDQSKVWTHFPMYPNF